ncbi:serine hydrolase [Paraflavitalea speifideaquila]|uniref:serine hydrolase n=1 Tax=Paraflavitalea speifideaquila TaxID=3076558 RepID=UPI0028EE95C1|nr:serine hydrolase [Paraflavitalea speifideiaquila]
MNKYTPMLTDSSYDRQTTVWTDTSAANGLPSVAQYIRKIFLVSDNDAYNRLYEFVGQQSLNEKLWQKGYKDSRITRRFVTMNEEQNQHTNAIRFMQNGQLIYEQPATYNTILFDFSKKYWSAKDTSTGTIASSMHLWILPPIIICRWKTCSRWLNQYFFQNRLNHNNGLN